MSKKKKKKRSRNQEIENRKIQGVEIMKQIVQENVKKNTFSDKCVHEQLNGIT